MQVNGLHSYEVSAFDFNLCPDSDMRWLLDELPHIPALNRPVWARIAAGMLWRNFSAEIRDLILTHHTSSSELQAVLPKCRKFDIYKTMERSKRASEIWNERQRLRREQRQMRNSRGKWIENVFAEIGVGNNSSWVSFCHAAWKADAADPQPDPKKNWERTNITASPGWRSQSVERQNTLTEFARRFLFHFEDDRKSRENTTNYTTAACAAVWLLRGELESNMALQERVRKHWLFGLLSEWDSGGDVATGLISIAYKLAPDLVLKNFDHVLISEVPKEGYMSCLRRYEGCWDESFFTLTSSFLPKTHSSGRAIRQTFAFLKKRNRARALVVFEDVVSQTAPTNTGTVQDRALLAVAMFLFTKERWDFAWSVISKAPDDDARTIFLEFASDYLDRHSEWATDLSEYQLAELYLAFQRWFPKKDYSEEHNPDSSVAARHHIPGIRRSIIEQMVGRATPAACHELRRVFESLSGDEQLSMRWRHRDAVNALLQKSWVVKSRSPAELLRMTKDSRTMTVDSEADLFDAVLASLDRLQAKLKEANATELEALWNRTKTALEPKDEHVLSNTITEWLRRDLGATSGVILNREVIVEPMLDRMDIKIEAAPPNRRQANPLTVVIEVKGCWNRDLSTSIGKQLVGKYLIPKSWRYGIYFIGWFRVNSTVRWNGRVSRIPLNKAKSIVEEWREAQTPSNKTIKTIILDCAVVAPIADQRRKAKRKT